jgi:hypothetical protein
MNARQAADAGLPADWYGDDGVGDHGRQEMLRQVAMIQAAQQRRN